jgi:eukaryotic-like serine/threonine-protein kinase
VSDTGVMLAGRYRLDAPIAAGAVGQVWRSTDLVLGRPVAVKLLRPEYTQHREILTRFRAEARHAGSLSHPGIAQVYDYGDADQPGSPYLVMELVDGPSLARVLASGPLDPARAMDVIAQAAAGLAAAHAAGLVHRDIKPGNLLLAPDGRVKITDFGIAHVAGSAPLTQTGALVGTPAYLAPERAAGGPATPASDLYSLGVVAYQCLAGDVPFSGPPLEILAAHRDRPLPPLPPGVPPGLAALAAELTAKDPAARPASAAVVAERAGRLRDTLAHGTAIRGGPGETPPAAPAADAQPATLVQTLPPVLADHHAPRRPPIHHRLRGGWPWPGRSLALALAAVALVAGLAGWLLASAFSGASFSGASPGGPARASTARPRPGTPASRTVIVNGGSLVGRPVSTVREQLSDLGLRSRVAWISSDQQAPGTVVSVQPTGQLRAGTIVLLTAVAQPSRHGNGNGNGNGNGDGGD